MSKEPPPERYASSPCMAGEVAPDYFDPNGVDPEQERDVQNWRKARRQELRALRDAISVADRRELGRVFCDLLRQIIGKRFGGAKGMVLAGYWPFRGEFDIRPLMKDLDEAGVLVTLPVVEIRYTPMIFRRWTRQTKLERGNWNIPEPTAESEELIPDIALAPFLGWTGEGYRLGYGGGHYDRTLSALGDRRPFTIGIGLQAAHLESIFPQPYDIPLDLIVTEQGVQVAPKV